MKPDTTSDLKQWARRHQLDAAEAEQLADRLRQTLRETSLDPVVEAGQAPVSGLTGAIPSKSKFTWAVLGALAGTAVMAVVFSVVSQPPPPATVPALSAQLAAHDASLIEVFREMESLFPESAEWVLSMGEEIEMGLERERAPDEQGYAVQYTVLSKTADSEWRLAWRGDLVTRRPDLCLTEKDICVFIQPLEDNLYAIDQDISLPGPVRFATRGVEVFSDGQPREIARLEEGGQSWRLFQCIRQFGDRS